MSAYILRVNSAGEFCDTCGRARSAGVPDVFFEKPYLDPHLVDPKDPKQHNGVWIESKRHKAGIMRNLGWREHGDRVHGARP